MADLTVQPSYGLVQARNGKSTKPVLEKTKAVSYNASQSDQIFAISSSASSATKEAMPNSIEVENNGGVPIMLMTGYQEYSDETTVSGSTEYLHQMLLPGEVFRPPIRAVIQTGEESDIMDGTVVDNAAPDSNEYLNSGTSINAGEGGTHVIGSATATNLWLPESGWTSATNGVHLLFRIGDLIRVNNEIMEVTEISSGADGTNNNYLTVIRGVHGSTAVDTHSADAAIRFPFFNAYHDFDKYSVAQTDAQGRFKAFNFFGLGRTATAVQGITPGSIAIKFYSQGGYQELGLSGITSSANSGLAVSTAYQFTIAVDGGSAYDLDFTTDASNVNWGGNGGILDKLNTVFRTQFYTAGNLFEKKVSVGIVGGDIRFTSGSHLSTSAVALGDSSGGDTDWWAVGRIPAVVNIDAAVASRLPDDVTYDRVTYATSPNTSVFCYDDGNGRLFGAAGGTINYETGAINMTGCPVNAEFVVSCAHTSAFSGKLNEGTTGRINSLVDIYANTPSQKWNGSVKIRTY